MKSTEAKAVFESRLKALGRSPCPKDAIECMIDFYRDTRADDCPLEQDGDMLLFQWGTHDWGQGKWVEINMTRQFTPTAGEGEEVFNLSLTMRFPPSSGQDAIHPGHRWCGLPSEVDDLKRFISELAPIQKSHHTACKYMAIEYYKTA